MNRHVVEVAEIDTNGRDELRRALNSFKLPMNIFKKMEIG